jgi:hypothetical protein
MNSRPVADDYFGSVHYLEDLDDSGEVVTFLHPIEVPNRHPNHGYYRTPEGGRITIICQPCRMGGYRFKMKGYQADEPDPWMSLEVDSPEDIPFRRTKRGKYRTKRSDGPLHQALADTIREGTATIVLTYIVA